MNVTIQAIEHKCTAPPGQDCGEVIARDGCTSTVLKYVIRGDGQKIPRLFESRDEAVTEAQKLGYTVTA